MGVAELISLAGAIGPLLKLYGDAKAAAIQNGDMTDAERAQLAAAEAAAFASHAWLTDAAGGL